MKKTLKRILYQEDPEVLEHIKQVTAHHYPKLNRAKWIREATRSKMLKEINSLKKKKI